MDDEIRTFADGRPSAPPYPQELRDRTRDRLMEETRGRRGFRLPRFGWQAAAAFGVTVTLVGGVAVALSGQQGSSVASPVTTASAVTVPGELNPRPDQYILIESDTMYTSETVGKGGKSGHWLYRSHRKIWQSVDAGKDGLLMIQMLDPKAWPGEQLPAMAKGEGGGEADWTNLASCPQRLGDRRTDYAFLSKLPTDPAQLRGRFYKPGEGKETSPDDMAFEEAASGLTETYMPKAQRDAYFEAVKSIPGVQVAEGVEDSAGRKGVALGRVVLGQLNQLIFDPESHVLLGERSTVTDAAVAKAPVGSVLALTAQTSITVVDALPKGESAQRDSSCDPDAQPSVAETPVPTPTGEVTVTETAAPFPPATSGEPQPAVKTPEATPTSAPKAEPTKSLKPTPTDAATSAPEPEITVTVRPKR